MTKENIDFDPNPNSQMPPDFFLNKQDHKKELLEVKAFNYLGSPAFDLADFRVFQKEVLTKPWMLDVDYLIFGYEMNDKGEVFVRDLWLKKIWELMRPMKKWSLTLQVKNNVVHKMRPGNWFSSKKKHKNFCCLEDFLAAMEEAVYLDPRTHATAHDWRYTLVQSWSKHYKTQLTFPRWSDIKNNYNP